MCITFVQRRLNVFDVVQHCINVIQMFCVYWVGYAKFIAVITNTQFIYTVQSELTH